MEIQLEGGLHCQYIKKQNVTVSFACIDISLPQCMRRAIMFREMLILLKMKK